MAMEYERIICVKNEVFVYKIPPRPTAKGFRAADWGLDTPDWTGRLRVVTKGATVTLKLEDKNSGELFAQCPVDAYPGVAVEQVLDSSRYFVIRIQNDGGRCAFIGIGFADRADSFDLLVTLQDHFKQVKREDDKVTALDPGPKLDLSFKEGQTIKINISTKKKTEEEEDDGTPKRSRPKPAAGMGFLPPPPGGVGIPKMTAPPGQPAMPVGKSAPARVQPQSNSGGVSDLLGDLSLNSAPLQPQPSSRPTGNLPQASDPWGDFTAAPNQTSSTTSSSASSNWVQF